MKTIIVNQRVPELWLKLSLFPRDFTDYLLRGVPGGSGGKEPA